MTEARPPLKGKKFLELSLQKLGEPLSCIPSVNDVALKSTGCFPLSFWALSSKTTTAWHLRGERLHLSCWGPWGQGEETEDANSDPSPAPARHFP